MKTITGNRYELKNNIETFLSEMSFDVEDIAEILKCKEKDPSHSLLIFVNEGGSTISITPSDADIYFYVLRNEKTEEVINETLETIRKHVQSGNIIEL